MCLVFDLIPDLSLKSQKGHFGWCTIGKQNIPYTFRGDDEKYIATRVVNDCLVKKYENILHPTVFTCLTIKTYEMVPSEMRLWNEINSTHCDNIFGTYFVTKDTLIKHSDAVELLTYFNNVINRLSNIPTQNNQGNPSENNGQSMKGLANGKGSRKSTLTAEDDCSYKFGFLELTKEALVPFVVINNEKHLPTFYFEGEMEYLTENCVKISGWDSFYLKFCCKVQQIQDAFYNKEEHELVRLSEVKKHFPDDFTCSVYWPKSAAKQYLLKNANSK